MLASAAIICLLQAVYFEARSEPFEGQVAVAVVVLNRVDDPSHPADVCAVVAEDRGPKSYDCQFSYMCDGVPETMHETKARHRAVQAVAAAIEGERLLEGALWYHANHVSPSWTKNLTQVTTIGSHVFYKED